MKKSLLTLTLLGCLSASAQQLTISTNVSYQFAQVAQTNTVLQGQMFSSPADALCIGQQLGAMTNSMGTRLFSPAYFTNRDFEVRFSVEDTNSMIPNWIFIYAVPGCVGQ